MVSSEINLRGMAYRWGCSTTTARRGPALRNPVAGRTVRFTSGEKSQIFFACDLLNTCPPENNIRE
jgi:hypothetical protein